MTVLTIGYITTKHMMLLLFLTIVHVLRFICDVCDSGQLCLHGYQSRNRILGVSRVAISTSSSSDSSSQRLASELGGIGGLIPSRDNPPAFRLNSLKICSVTFNFLTNAQCLPASPTVRVQNELGYASEEAILSI